MRHWLAGWQWMSRGAELVLGSEIQGITVPWRWKERKLKWLSCILKHCGGEKNAVLQSVSFLFSVFLFWSYYDSKSSKCLFMHELLQTLAETLHIITCFAPAGRQNKLQANIPLYSFGQFLCEFFFKDETTCESCWRAVAFSQDVPASNAHHQSTQTSQPKHANKITSKRNKNPNPKNTWKWTYITWFFLDKNTQPQKFATLQLPGWSVALLAPVKAPCWKRWREQDQHSLGTALVGEVGWQEGGKPRRQRMEVVIDDCWEFLAGPSSFVWKMMKKGTWRWKCLFIYTRLRCAKVSLWLFFDPPGDDGSCFQDLIFFWESFEHLKRRLSAKKELMKIILEILNEGLTQSSCCFLAPFPWQPLDSDSMIFMQQLLHVIIKVTVW